MPLDGKLKASIVRTRVGNERGTGFLVSSERKLVLTALHCVAFPDSFQALTPEVRPGPIKVRFGHPQAIPAGSLETGAHFETDAKLINYYAPLDVALLECTRVPDGVDPIELGQCPDDIDAWNTFGFPNASGFTDEDPVEVNGQTCDGTIASASFRIQLNLNQIGQMDLRGISGAPILVGGRAIGIVLQTLTNGVVVVQNTIFGHHVESFADHLPALAWNRSEPAGYGKLVAVLDDLKASQLEDAACVLKVSKETQGLSRRVATAMLTRPLIDSFQAFNQHIRPFRCPPPEVQVLGLLLCAARIPAPVVKSAEAALGPQAPLPATLRIGAHKSATAKALAFHFALAARGLGEVHMVLADLGSLPGAEKIAAHAKEKFAGEIERLMECEGADLAKAKRRWERAGRDIFVIAEVGLPDDLQDTLKEVYPRVRVLFCGAPPQAPPGAGGAPVIAECVHQALEEDFEFTLDELR